MKKNCVFSIVFATLFCSTVGYGQTTKTYLDYLTVPGPIVFESKSYNLVWSSHPSANFYKQEYLAKGDTITKFKTMVMLDVMTTNMKVKDIVATKVSELKKMKETNPVINYEMFEKNGEYILDFLLSANTPDGKLISTIERNVYRYKVFTDKSGQKGVVLFGVSMRSYGNDVDKFLVNLKSTRSKLITEVAQFNIPQITLKK
jgi:hypothetical protein